MSQTKKIFGVENPEVYQDIFNYISQFVPLEDRLRSATVSRAWASALAKDPQWKQAGVGGSHNKDNFHIRFNALHPHIKKLVKWGACDLVTAEKIHQVWNQVPQAEYINHLPLSIKNKLLDPNYPHQHLVQHTTGFALLMCGLIDPDEARSVPTEILNVFLTNWEGYYNDSMAIYALSKKLITLKVAKTMTSFSLSILLKKHGVKALEEGLITLADVPHAMLGVFNLFLSDTLQEPHQFYAVPNPNRERNIKVLRDKLLSFKDAAEMPIESLRAILTDLGIQMLTNKLVNVNQLRAMPNFSYVTGLLSAWGNFALENFLVTPEEIALMPNGDYVHATLSQWACVALRDGLIDLADIKAMPNANYVSAFLNKWGVQALRVELVTPEQVQALADSRYAAAIFTQWGFEALTEDLISMDFLNSIPYPDYLEVLMSENGLKALRQKLIRLDHITDANLNLDTLRYLLGEGFSNLEKGLVKIDDVIHSEVHTVRANVLNIKAAIDNICNYKTMLSTLNAKRLSRNNKVLGIEKVKLLDKFFTNNSLKINQQQLVSVLGDKTDPMLLNRSRFPLKFFKVRSFFKGQKNPLLNNRYCESQTEVNLVQLYNACQAAQAA